MNSPASLVIVGTCLPASGRQTGQNAVRMTSTVTVIRIENSALMRRIAFIALLLSACTAPEEPPGEPEAPGGLSGVRCIENGTGYVNGELFGAIQSAVLWPNEGTECEGMQRPQNGGARLRFSRRFADSDDNMVLIIGISQLKKGATGNGYPANVTLIDERDSRFFSNGGVPNCWVDIYRQHELEADQTQLEGILYCSGALANQAGGGGVNPRDLRFSGQIDWSPPASQATEASE